MAEAAKPVQLAPPTLEAFHAYIAEAERSMQPCFSGTVPFLWQDLTPELSQRVQDGQIAAQSWSGKHPINVPQGLIHDWIGITFVAGVTLPETLALIQDYDHHHEMYKPDVIGSRLLTRDGDDFQILLRLRKKKVVTVVLDTFHEVHYVEVSPTQWMCRSLTTSIREVENAGTPTEAAAEPDTGNGYLWRLNSYWNFQQRDEGMWLECRAISLSRDVPKGLAWIIDPIIRKLPRESLVHTLDATRKALQAQKTPKT